MNSPIISFNAVSKVFSRKGESVTALDNINLTIQQGEIFGVIGASGAGKSTLLRLINSLETADRGEVLINGVSLQGLSGRERSQAKKDIGMIFQHFNLLNSRTVFHNVAIPLILQRRSKQEIRERVRELLAFVNLSDKAQSYPDELSGGQKQRVGIARALATNPSVLLCDEATSALDPHTTVQILLLLQEINRRYGITIVLITHEMSVVQKICHKVAVMSGGRIVEQGNVLDLFSQPQQAVTAGLVETVIHDRLPEQTLAAIREQPDGRALRLEFVGQTAQQPIINQLIRDYPVQVNILFASMSEVSQTILGFMILRISGQAADIDSAVGYLVNAGVKISDV
ncbi:methionine ABC transporter ATP-binding protein [Tatumella citrea]|uniref:Cell division ATP-binding protein FtsE n=1 Tax=Tatumella citrea TaxID=53336 RepID=A0A1Y0LCI0_TATCI|nr:methionine ABC transporter ATP-binding protein [Tatumella citrea]ARU99420.1 methionine ABC transporter ATP-binding protein [Tatumella citrea]